MPRSLLVLACALGLASCQMLPRSEIEATSQASISATDLAEFAETQDVILRYLAESIVKIPYPPAAVSPDWYLIAEAGYAYIDQRCARYLSALRDVERDKGRRAGLLSVLGTTASAILTITDVPKATLGIVAQAFGLAGNLNAVLADSHLYKIPAGNVAEIVKKLQTAYREEDAASSDAVLTAAAASTRMRGYLELCLPVYIDGQVASVLANATAAAGPGGGGEADLSALREAPTRRTRSSAAIGVRLVPGF